MKKAKEYKIETIQELVDLATSKNIEGLVIDLTEFLLLNINLFEKMKKENPELKKKKNSEIMKVGFNWIDDGIRGVTRFRLTNTDTGKTKTVKVKK